MEHIAVQNDTTTLGVMQMLQSMTPPYLRYLHGQQPWPETHGLWPFGKQRRQAARRTKAEQIAHQAINRRDIQRLVLLHSTVPPTDVFQTAELLIHAITPHVLTRQIEFPLDPYVFALLAEQIQQIAGVYFAGDESASTVQRSSQAGTDNHRKRQRKHK